MTEHTDEQYDKQRRMKNSYAEANIEQAKKLDALRVELMDGERIRMRLDAELAAERTNLQMIVDDNNRRYQSVNGEVVRLRDLLKENGISPEA